VKETMFNKKTNKGDGIRQVKKEKKRNFAVSDLSLDFSK
jgi:hypothetical protein